MKSTHLAKQPSGLAVFFATEMWERYGFYVIQGLLILYLVEHFHFNDVTSYAILGSFTALAFSTPIIGGYFADKILGYRHAVILGGILLCIGYSIIAVSVTMSPIYVALGAIAMGTGLLKPNVSALLGTLYQKEDPRRDSGFTIFYVGINIGVLASALASGYIARYFGWHNSFASASAGLVMGTLVFFYGTRIYQIRDQRHLPYAGRLGTILTYCVIAGCIALGAMIIRYAALADICFSLLVFASLALVTLHASKHANQRQRITAFFVLVTISVVFWAFYFQLYFSLNLFILRLVNHHMLGLNVPTPVFLGIESVGIVVFGPILSRLWRKLKAAHRDPSTPMKFAIGMLLMSATWGILLLSTLLTRANTQVNPLWLIAAYLVLSLGELSLSAIGLAMVTELIPAPLVGLMMGIWFVSLGIGGKLAGVLADVSAIPQHLHNTIEIQSIYRHAFSIYLAIAMGATLIAFMAVPVVKRLIKSETTAARNDTFASPIEKKRLKVATT